MLSLAAGAVCLAAAAWSPASGSYAPDAEVLLEGGVASPAGDLGDDYIGTVKGLGAETGYEIGLRYRYYFSDRFALSPSFHFVDFGDFIGEDGDNGLIQVSPTVISYGVDAQYYLPGDRGRLRPFLTGGLALSRNRHRVEFLDFQEYIKEPFNALSFTVGGGLRLGDFEWTAAYHVNRFSTARLFATDVKEDYSWDYLVVRVGFAFPTR